MKIKMLVMDVDGTLTDGRIYISPQGEVMKAFDVKDGYGIVHLKTNEIVPVIITGRESVIVQERARELGITELYQGVTDKLECLKAVADKLGYSREEIAYIGDDENDLECMKYCSISGCPNDAISKVKKEISYVCEANGGRGAVREFIEWIFDKQDIV